MATEEPTFKLITQDGPFELRDYPALVVAQVTVQGSQTAASRTGFRKLARYIFGGNDGGSRIAMTTPVTKVAARARAGQKIAMTAPVMMNGAPGDWIMRFIMPAGRTIADLPQPNDPDVTLHDVPALRYAVLRFSGLAGAAKVEARSQDLLAWAAARGLPITGPVTLARYDPPWTPWFLRRNEVMAAVDGDH